MKITFPYWGNYTIAFNALFQKLGVDFVSPERSNSKSIEEGAKISPEMYCLPLKVNIGNYLKAVKKGADTVFMVTHLSGSCRLRYFAIVQEKILSDIGHKVDFVVFNQNPIDIYSKIKNISGASFGRIVSASFLFFKKLNLIEMLEKKARYLRSREIIKGETREVLKLAFKKIDRAGRASEISKLKKEILKKISEIKIDKNKKVPRVGIIGEIFIVTDDSVNFKIEEKLGEAGIEAYCEMNITYHLKKKAFPWKNFKIQKKAMPYLESKVGGHGIDAVCEMIEYSKENFDGIVHLLPFGCMPETTVRPILEKIHKESGIPFLSLSLDEQVAEAGINTRIEAFVDVVKNYCKSK